MTNFQIFFSQIGYEESFLSKKYGYHSNAQAYIRSLLPHLQADFCHSSLGTQVKIQVEGDFIFYEGMFVEPTEYGIESMKETTEKDLGDADLMLYMVALCDQSLGTREDCYGGIAYISTVCIETKKNQFKQSLNGLLSTVSATAQIMAHEVGHNLGMWHDHEPFHQEAGCDKTGIMSYYVTTNQWSTCSKADFHAHYLNNKDDWCLERNFFKT